MQARERERKHTHDIVKHPPSEIEHAKAGWLCTCKFLLEVLKYYTLVGTYSTISSKTNWC